MSRTFIPDSHTFDIIAKICRKHEIIPMQAKNWVLSNGKVGRQIWVDTRNPGIEFPECCLVGIHMGAELGVQESGHGYTDTTDNLRSEIMIALEKAKPKVPAVQKVEVKPDEAKHPVEKKGEDVANKVPETTISAPKPEVKSEVKVPKVVPPEPKKAIKVPVCSVAECGIEVLHARALDQVTSGNKVMCESCEERAEILKQNEPESQRDAPKPGKINQSIPEAPKAKAEPKTPEVIAPQRKNQPVPARIPMRSCTPQGRMIKNFQIGLEEIGKIKIGKKGASKTSTSGKDFRMPVKLDHFEVKSIIRDETTGDFLPDEVMKVLGDSPKSLGIMLLFNDPTLNFLTSYNQYKSGKCLCRGDGETATQADGSTIECDPEVCQFYLKKECKLNGILSVILTDSPRLGGVYKFRTTSVNTIRSILSSLFFLSTQTGGILAMIPLRLTLSPKQVHPDGLAKAVTIYVANIEFAGTAPELVQKMFEVQKYQSSMRESIQRLEATARNFLTAPESPEEEKDVADEWYPESKEVR